MRLIDADKLIEKLKGHTRSLNCEFNSACRIIIEVINTQPTAYDVDKVVKELERKSKIHNMVGESKNDITNIYASACYDEAIEIVKEGWIDERNI